ncbi:MAG: hypothetical protein COU33_05145 [Candidatus Magasanikbacteria bacterium CG10_big_fil_rev_8_21_14_0_10_43_6]|uniref:Branched-chain amino acid aminotransferase n=1 Tax=Candidatus Magasanikbacteria bacterium CG10_big_fil_rev_8_21_14_0_10_43_6 TaxID=1974650 RepID=A0A2M6VZT8_9BACT|nr:MAG: hypothetical protein COU33_05145 [Candidatus Magasanikbacteria bacterium CG10_big_fil_rev_8_21_14_0_10_43_6]
MNIRVESTNGEVLPVGEGAVYAAASAGAHYGPNAFTRMRARVAQDGAMRIFALHRHLERTARGAALFHQGDELEGHVAQWPEWIYAAVREYLSRGGNGSLCYIHLGVGAFTGQAAMLQKGGGLVTYISVDEQPPLYGEGIYAVTEGDWPRPWGPLSHLKFGGPYAELMFLKERARQWAAKHQVSVPHNYRVEALLYDRYDRDVLSEFGCANAGWISRNGAAVLFSNKDRFVGITEQAIRMLVCQHTGMEVAGGNAIGLTQRVLLSGSPFAMGTAAYGPVPVVWLDGVDITPVSELEQLHELYFRLWDGELPESDAWTTVVPGC